VPQLRCSSGVCKCTGLASRAGLAGRLAAVCPVVLACQRVHVWAFRRRCRGRFLRGADHFFRGGRSPETSRGLRANFAGTWTRGDVRLEAVIRGFVVSGDDLLPFRAQLQRAVVTRSRLPRPEAVYNTRNAARLVIGAKSLPSRPAGAFRRGLVARGAHLRRRRDAAHRRSCRVQRARRKEL
jgi:hypothetical protein